MMRGRYFDDPATPPITPRIGTYRAGRSRVRYPTNVQVQPEIRAGGSGYGWNGQFGPYEFYPQPAPEHPPFSLQFPTRPASPSRRHFSYEASPMAIPRSKTRIPHHEVILGPPRRLRRHETYHLEARPSFAQRFSHQRPVIVKRRVESVSPIRTRYRADDISPHRYYSVNPSQYQQQERSPSRYPKVDSSPNRYFQSEPPLGQHPQRGKFGEGSPHQRRPQKPARGSKLVEGEPNRVEFEDEIIPVHSATPRFSFIDEFRIPPSQQRKVSEVHGKLDYDSFQHSQTVPDVLGRSKSHSSAKNPYQALKSRVNEIKKSQSFHHGSRASSSSERLSRMGIPDSAFDIHRLIFESDERLRAMLAEQSIQKSDSDPQSDAQRSSSEREFDCQECGSRNVVRTKSHRTRCKPECETDENQNYIPSSQPRGASKARQRRNFEFFRSKSSARFLKPEEQIKIQNFRRFLLGAGVGYHDFLEEVTNIREKEKAQSASRVDEDGIPDQKYIKKDR